MRKESRAKSKKKSEKKSVGQSHLLSSSGTTYYIAFAGKAKA